MADPDAWVVAQALNKNNNPAKRRFIVMDKMSPF
jgi:hypothetical protein